MMNKILYSWSLRKKLMKLAKGLFCKLHMKYLFVLDPLYAAHTDSKRPKLQANNSYHAYKLSDRAIRNLRTAVQN